MTEQIVKQLDLLADYKDQLAVFELQKTELRASILTPEIRTKLAEIEDEFAGQVDVVNAKIAVLTEEVKNAVLAIGETVKGKYIMVTWNKPRVTWDTHGLNGYALAGHQELMAFQKIGDPSTTIRDIRT